ncbi:PorP/SprF family type IX secretion system membrane protein [Bacteroidia bacterium]|nr:PorP/SprF family type IX secretion system membrane protein [Bacteroidia bacterium]
MNKKILLVAVCFGLIFKAYGQQDPQYTQFMFNKQMYNPAVTGFDGKHCVAILARTQYVKYEDQTYTLNDQRDEDIDLYGQKGAKTVTFSYGAPIPFARAPKGPNSGGVGLSVFQDQVGYLTTSYYKGDFAFRKQLAFDKAIGVGVNIGAMQKTVNVDGLIYKDPNDPRIPNDKNPSGINVNFGTGVWFNNPNFYNLTLGYAVQNLSSKPFQFASVAAIAPGWHQYLNASAEFTPGGLMVRPYLLIKASQNGAGFANPDFNLGALADLSTALQAGLSLRTSTKTFESLSAIIGYNLNPQLRIGYSFDINTSGLRTNNNNTHEVVLNYCFNIAVVEKQSIRLLDPRHLDKDSSIE